MKLSEIAELSNRRLAPPPTGGAVQIPVGGSKLSNIALAERIERWSQSLSDALEQSLTVVPELIGSDDPELRDSAAEFVRWIPDLTRLTSVTTDVADYVRGKKS